MHKPTPHKPENIDPAKDFKSLRYYGCYYGCSYQRSTTI